MSFLRSFQSQFWRASSFTASNRFTAATSTSTSKPLSPFSKSIGGVACFSLFGFTFGGNSPSSSGGGGGGGSGSGSSQSSSLLREKSPAAFRKQPTTLIFVSAEKVSQSELQATREKWVKVEAADASRVEVIFRSSLCWTKPIPHPLCSLPWSLSHLFRWYNWIAYFREAGFDCLDIHLNVSDSVKAECDSIEKESKVLGEGECFLSFVLTVLIESIS